MAARSMEPEQGSLASSASLTYTSTAPSVLQIGSSPQQTTHISSDSKRPDPEDVAELGTTLVYATVAEANNGFSFDASNSSSVYEVPTSSSSGSNASGGDDGGIFEAIIRGIGHMFEASSS
ncbi:hypothetical protein Tco_1526047 [Tanacetum coccineum]